MDTISSNNNVSFSYLPVLALIVGLIAGILGGVALAKVSNINKSFSEQSAVADRVDVLESELRTAAASAEAATTRINKVANDTNDAFKKFSEAFVELRNEFAEMRTPVNAVAPVDSSGSSAAAGEYTVKSGDTGSGIARAAGVSLTALLNANPDVDWNRLSIGRVLVIPGN